MSSAPPIARNDFPARLGRYEVRAKIGDGGMASVYLGHLRSVDGAPPRSVAIKVIKAEFSKHPDFVTMFLDEAKIVSQLSHPNLVDVIEIGNEGERLFIAMELLFGQSLWHVWDVCRDRGVRLRYDMAAWIGARVGHALHHAHELKDANGEPLMLVHRDVNASNVFITYDGQVKVIDFGLAKAANRAYKTAAGVVKGKLAYLSPEQVGGQGIDRRSDVFALGTTLWELTTDRRLFRVKDDTETLKRVYAADVPDPTLLVEGYPPMLWQILKRALGRDPSTRYASAADFARSLDAYAQSEGRAVDASAVGQAMRELFTTERERDAAWLAEASAQDGPAPTSTMHPPQAQTIAPVAEPTAPGVPGAMLAPPRMPGGLSQSARDWARGAPPDGMFSPAPSKPPHDVRLVHEPTKVSTPYTAPSPERVPHPVHLAPLQAQLAEQARAQSAPPPQTTSVPPTAPSPIARSIPAPVETRGVTPRRSPVPQARTSAPVAARRVQGSSALIVIAVAVLVVIAGLIVAVWVRSRT